jgi:hypothetical protein
MRGYGDEFEAPTRNWKRSLLRARVLRQYMKLQC